MRATWQIVPSQIPVRAAAAVQAAKAVPFEDLLAQGWPPCFASAVRSALPVATVVDLSRALGAVGSLRPEAVLAYGGVRHQPAIR